MFHTPFGASRVFLPSCIKAFFYSILQVAVLATLCCLSNVHTPFSLFTTPTSTMTWPQCLVSAFSWFDVLNGWNHHRKSIEPELHHLGTNIMLSRNSKVTMVRVIESSLVNWSVLVTQQVPLICVEGLMATFTSYGGISIRWIFFQKETVRTPW